jgi:hypothetical protein
MKMTLNLFVVAVLLLAAAGPCFALWEIADISRERAKELGMEVRSTPAGPTDVRVELEFPTAGALKDFSRVDLLFGEGGKTLVTAPLQEDRSKPGRVVVGFAADRTRLDRITLWVMVPGSLGGTIYQLRVKDFVAPEKGR